MNRFHIRHVLLCFAVAAASGCQKLAEPDGDERPSTPPDNVQLTLSLKIARDVWVMTDWSEPPQITVWLEDPPGSDARTLFVTHRTGAGDWKGKAGCNVSLPYWVGRYNVETATSGPPTFQRPAPDAVTRPTPKTSLAVDTLVPPGSQWRYFVEVNVSGDFNEAFPERLSDGQRDEAGNGQPSLVYGGHITAVAGRRDTPTLIGRTDQLRAASILRDDLSGITTAGKLLSDIVMSCSATAASSTPTAADAHPVRSKNSSHEQALWLFGVE